MCIRDRKKTATSGDCAKWTGAETASASDTLVGIDFRNAMLVLFYSSNRTGIFTRNTVVYNGMEWTALHALSALDALVFIDVSLASHIFDGILWTVGGARAGKTAATCIRHLIL